MSTTTILITGCNQGLGFETARQLSKLPNIHIFISGRDSARVQDALVKITTAEGFQASVDTVIIGTSNDEHQGGREECVFLDFETEAKGLRRMFEETYAVNVFGAAIMADAFLPSLKKSTTEGGARILNLGSGLGCISTTSDPEGEFKGNHFIAYNSSKTALNSITCTLAMKSPDIHVVSVDPGYNSTGLNGYSGHMDPKDGVKVIVQHALGKVGKSPGFYSNFGEVPW